MLTIILMALTDVSRPDRLSSAEIASICQAAGLQGETSARRDCRPDFPNQCTWLAFTAVRKNRYVILPGDFDEAWKVSSLNRFIDSSSPTGPSWWPAVFWQRGSAKRVSRHSPFDKRNETFPFCLLSLPFPLGRVLAEYLYPDTLPLNPLNSKSSRKVTILTSSVRTTFGLYVHSIDQERVSRD